MRGRDDGLAVLSAATAVVRGVADVLRVRTNSTSARGPRTRAKADR
ncbi:hypothetical protein [Actinophytocola sp.]